ncbi:Protein angel 2 [Mortierella alpina]|nr:Protein angel 2 [Mortierella alpina]
MVALGYGGNLFKKRNTAVEHGFCIFYKSNRATLISECPIPFPQGDVEGVDNPGVMLVLEIDVGVEKQRVCVATTHIPCADNRGGLRKMGQVMALLAAARALVENNWSMPFILTGDFNAHLGDFLIEYVLSGSVDLRQMPIEKRKNPVILTGSMMRAFKAQTQALRVLPAPSSSVSMAPKLKAVEKPSEVKKLSEAENLSTMIRAGRDLMDMVVSNTMRTSSVYGLDTIVDFIFHGSIIGGRQLQVVSRLELPERLALLKGGLPAGHLGSDHFAIGAKFRIADWVPVVGRSGTSNYSSLPDYIGLPDDDDEEEMVEVDVGDKKRYFS